MLPPRCDIGQDVPVSQVDDSTLQPYCVSGTLHQNCTRPFLGCLAFLHELRFEIAHANFVAGVRLVFGTFPEDTGKDDTIL